MPRPKRFKTRAEYLRWRYWNDIEKSRKEVRERARFWRLKNPEKAKEQDKIKRKKYKLRRSRYNSRYYKKRIKEDIKFRIRHTFSSAISARLRKRISGKKNKSTFKDLPYTLEDLMKHLEKRFTEGMSWNNYGKWHIDHKIPDCKFDYKSTKDKFFQKCWSLDNLQPMWAIDNIKKGSKLYQTY